MNSLKSNKFIIPILTVICSIVYISLIFNSNVWMDEAFTGSLAHNSFIGVLYLSMMDTLPPLYNIILKLMTDILGYTIPVMKLTSTIPMICTMILGATTVRKRFGNVTAAAFILCLTGMPLMLNYGVEIRMYSLGFFFATASGIYAYEVICESTKKNWILFTLFSVLSGYSHHFAFLTVGFVYLFLLLYYFIADRKHIVRWFKCLGFTVLFYLPCLVITLMQISRVSGYFSMPDVTISLFVQYVLYPYMVGKLSASLLCILLVAVILVIFAIKFLKNENRDVKNVYSIYCFAIYYGVLLFGTVISKIMTANIFVDRYLFFSTGLLWLFIAIQLGTLSAKSVSVAAVFLVYISVCSYLVEFDVEYSSSADEEIAYLQDNIEQGDIFFGIGGHEEMENCIPFLSKVSNGAELTFVYPLDNALETARNNNVNLWISVLDEYDVSPEEAGLIDAYGYELIKQTDFEFDRYKCELYKAVLK